MKHRVWIGQAKNNGLQCKQTAGLQRVALQRHGQAEDEFADQQPAGHEWAHCDHHDGIHDQEQNDGQLVPFGSLPQKVVQNGSCDCFWH